VTALLTFLVFLAVYLVVAGLVLLYVLGDG